MMWTFLFASAFSDNILSIAYIDYNYKPLFYK